MKMPLMYKKGDKRITLEELIKQYPSIWDFAVKDKITWLDTGNKLDELSLIDIVLEVIDKFEDTLYSEEFDEQSPKPMVECSNEEYDELIEKMEFWRYDDISTIDRFDIIAILST